jgi:hypothetical protein
VPNGIINRRLRHSGAAAHKNKHMELQERISLLTRLGEYIESNSEAWQADKYKAFTQNGWFVEEFVNLAANNIRQYFLQPEKLAAWAASYKIPAENTNPKTVGIVMAGNIPLVGFHDFLCGFITGHKLAVKPSSKDAVLTQHLLNKLLEWAPELSECIVFAERLVGCNAYIATGSNNSGRYFDYYFRNYPSIIRKNRTSVAVLNGSETTEELENLADDLLLYFGLGCRNVSKLYVPKEYDFIPLLAALNKYKWMEDHHKFKNNYDYNLSLHILNYQYYMTNGTLLLIEKAEIFSAISQANFEFYEGEPPTNLIETYAEQIQCVVGAGYLPFGQAQSPSLTDYADGVDTVEFFTSL